MQDLRSTLLAIQRTSKAGWTAATPHIWHTVEFRQDDDYLSFFAPITRFVDQLQPQPCTSGLVSAAAALADGDAGLPEDVQRFFRSAGWIRAMDFDATPPRSLKDEVPFAHGIAINILNKIHYLGLGVVVRLYEIIQKMGCKRYRRDIQLLGRFLADSKPAIIEVSTSTVASFGEDAYERFWHDLSVISPEFETGHIPPVVLHNMTVNDLIGGLPYRDLTVHMCSGWQYNEENEDATSQDLILDLGMWVTYALLQGDNDHQKQGGQGRARLGIWGWLGCPCKCNLDEYPDVDGEEILEEIKSAAKVTAAPGQSLEGRIQTFFDDKRLVLYSTPCENYLAGLLEEQE